MNAGTRMKRSGAVRKVESDEHDRSNPFCATHPELSRHTISHAKDDSDESNSSAFHRVPESGIRGRVRATHVLVSKRK